MTPSTSGRSSYAKHLYVPRTGEPGSDDTLPASIEVWARQRSKGAAKPIYCLEGPPGIGKTWILERFIDLYRQPLADVVVIIGPLTPPSDYTIDWIRQEIIERYVLKPPYSISSAQIQREPDASFQNSIFTLVDDLERAAPDHHFLFVLDDVDQALDLEALEEKLIEPIAILSDSQHRVSLLIAMRSDIRFAVVDALRRPSKFLKQVVPPFDRNLARQQIALLLEYARACPPELQPDSLLSSLPRPYTWGIAALNAVLAKEAQTRHGGGELTWSPSDLVLCMAHSLRLDPASDLTLLAHTHVFRQSRYPDGWQIYDVQKHLDLADSDASSFRDQLSALDLIERPPGTAFGTYQLTHDWNSIFECLPDGTFTLASPARGTL